MAGRLTAAAAGVAMMLALAQPAAADDGSALPAYDISDAVVSMPEFRDFGQGKGGLDGLAAAIMPAAGPAGHHSSFVEDWFGRVETPKLGPYSFTTFWDQASSIPLEFAALTAVPLYQGIRHWNWGNSSFHFTDEGWFGMDTHYLGVDKLGHAYTTYFYSDFFTQRIAHKFSDPTGAAITGALMGFAIQAGVEVGDSFSPKYGFSKEDLISDGIGAGFSLLRNAVPGLASKLDYRMEYMKSPHHAFDPISDYDGQKFLLALKFSGFEQFQDSPLRFVELQAGYFARGVTPESRHAGMRLRREPYVAVGLNLQELLDATPARDSGPEIIADRALEFLQVPYTYAASKQK